MYVPKTSFPVLLTIKYTAAVWHKISSNTLTSKEDLGHVFLKNQFLFLLWLYIKVNSIIRYL
jgi:hypothetical protein